MSSVLQRRPLSTAEKRRFVNVVKMLLDIAKESSNGFPPLKLCLGGINTMIKYYNEYNNMKDKLDDLILWLEKLHSLAKVNPNGDHEEVKRQSQLVKSLEEVGIQLLVLSGKRKLAQVLNKVQDSQEIVKLVDKLQQAILCWNEYVML